MFVHLLLAIIIARYIYLYLNNDTNIEAMPWLENLRHVRDQTELKTKSTRIAIGYNGCIDAIVDALKTLKLAGFEPVSTIMDSETIDTDEELSGVFEFHFGKAGERAITDRSILNKLTETLPKTLIEKKLGGNAALMADVLARDWGFEHVMLGAQVGPAMKSLLHERISVVQHDEAIDFSVLGQKIPIRSDEIHLIMEYDAGSTWGKKTSPRANRFIVSNDMSNAYLAPMETLHNELHQRPYNMLITSGFHMLDAEPAHLRESRLDTISKVYAAIEPGTRVHVELASIGDVQLLHKIIEHILPHADSVGMNEQELAAFYRALFPESTEELIEAIGEHVPDIETVSVAIEAILDKLNRISKHRKIQRIHLHCLGYHLIVQPENAGANWPNAKSAAAAGSVKASERACATENLVESLVFAPDPKVLEQVQSLAPFSENHPVAEWKNARNLVFTLAPVIVCRRALQTVGLGDAISATALAFQI